MDHYCAAAGLGWAGDGRGWPGLAWLGLGQEALFRTIFECVKKIFSAGPASSHPMGVSVSARTLCLQMIRPGICLCIERANARLRSSSLFLV